LPKLKKPISFETTFGTYVVDELLGEGGAGRVYGGKDNDQSPIALKILAEDRATTDKRRRFKNEISFLSRNKHQNIVTVIDHGIAPGPEAKGPFYMGSYGALLGKDPGQFVFQGDRTTIRAQEHEVQTIINHFKDWLPKATQTLRLQLEQRARKQEID
jgi:serine/threonine protein kinase